MAKARGVAALVAAAAIGLAACGGSSSPRVASLPTVASLGKSSGSGNSGGSSTTNGTGGSPATTLPNGNATKLVDEWADCERSHGDPNQPDPTIDAHGVINITIPTGGLPAGDPHDVTGKCSEYIAAAQRALRAADPVPDPLGMDNQADLLKYVNCMRASGVPNYPYPQGNTTNFNGTGVDPTSPVVVKISIRCGNKLYLPLWWSAGWGPPGDVTVGMTPPPGAHPPGALVPATGAANGGPPPGPAGSSAISQAGTGG